MMRQAWQMNSMVRQADVELTDKGGNFRGVGPGEALEVHDEQEDSKAQRVVESHGSIQLHRH